MLCVADAGIRTADVACILIKFTMKWNVNGTLCMLQLLLVFLIIQIGIDALIL